MQRLLYVSKSLIEPSDAGKVVLQIVKHAEVKNAQLNVTGALIFTGQHFAQVFEGSPEAISTLMAHICDDPRHTNIVVAYKSTITGRQFFQWRMAYNGPTPFVSRQVTRLLETTSHPDAQRAAERLIYLASEFCRSHTPP